MPTETEPKQGSWLGYATTFVVVLPVLYVLSSGPARCIERTETGSYAVAVNTGFGIPYRQGPFALCRWTPTIRRVFYPLELLADNSATGKALNWYWDLFGIHWHYEEYASTAL